MLIDSATSQAPSQRLILLLVFGRSVGFTLWILIISLRLTISPRGPGLSCSNFNSVNIQSQESRITCHMSLRDMRGQFVSSFQFASDGFLP